jgi:hypothetical protein
MCFARLLEQAAIISLYSVSKLDFRRFMKQKIRLYVDTRSNSVPARHPVSAIKPIFWTFMKLLLRFNYNFSCKHEFRENLVTNIHTLPKDVNKFSPYFPYLSANLGEIQNNISQSNATEPSIFVTVTPCEVFTYRRKINVTVFSIYSSYLEKIRYIRCRQFIEQLGRWQKATYWKSYVTSEWKLISICSYLIYYPIWVKFFVIDQHIILSLIYEVC